jgi:hypothetical protein
MLDERGADAAGIAAALGEGLGDGFVVALHGDLVVVVNPSLGAAAVVRGDEAAAGEAAAALSLLAGEAGVPWPCMGFAVSSGAPRPPWVVRSGREAATDILFGMARGIAARPPFGNEAMARILAACRGPSARPAALPAPAELDPAFLRLAEAAVDKVLGGQGAFLEGFELFAKDIVSPRFLLPALLVAAADSWAIPVVASKGRGGFLVRLRPDPEALVGYTVTGVDMSAPLLLFLPMVNLVRRSFTGGECVLDGTVRTFAKFLRAHGLNADVMEDVDVRVATSA